MAYNVYEIANWIISEAEKNENSEFITNLKLQKLLYYFQGFYMANFDKVLFDNDIESWQYGPVVPIVYDKFKKFGRDKLSLDNNNEIAKLNPEEEVFLSEVFNIYNQFSAIGLMELTHNEKPWKETPHGSGCIIDKKLLSDFFKTKLED